MVCAPVLLIIPSPRDISPYRQSNHALSLICYTKVFLKSNNNIGLSKLSLSTELQIKWGTEDNSKIFFLFLNENIYVVTPH